MAQARHQVRIGDKGPAKGHRVDLAFSQARLRQCQVVVVVADIRAVKQGAQRIEVHAIGHPARGGGGAFDKVQIRQLEAVQVPDQIAIGGHHVAVDGRIAGVGRDGRQADADLPRAPHIDHRLCYLQGQTGTVGDRAAIGVRAVVG